MTYAVMTQKRAWEFLVHSDRVILSNNPGIFDDSSFEKMQLRSRCLFVKEENSIYIFLTLSEDDFHILPHEIFFYGAQGQENIVRIRVLSKIRVVMDMEKIEVLTILKERTKDKKSYINSINYIHSGSQDERELALEELSGAGKLYCLEPIAYAYAIS